MAEHRIFNPVAAGSNPAWPNLMMIKFQTPHLKIKAIPKSQNYNRDKYRFKSFGIRNFLFGIWIFGWMSPVFHSDDTTQKITVHFFYSPDCGHCMEILSSEIPRLQKKYSFRFKKYDLNILENYRLLEEMEKDAKEFGEDLPIVFVGDSAFYGQKEVKEKLESTIRRYSPPKKPVARDTTKINQDTIEVDTATINLYYFYQTNCPECTRIDLLLNGLIKKYPNIRVFRYDILTDTSKIFYETIAQIMEVPEERRLLVPAIFLGEDYLIKEFSAESLESIIKKYQKGSLKLDTLKTQSGEKAIIDRFLRFSILGIVAAGLLDGVNPCAFATIIFFISYLLFIGRKQKEIFIMSISFIGAVFISYLSIGIGAYSLLTFLSKFRIITRVIFISFGIMAFVLGGLSIYDYIIARSSKPGKMILQLPLGIKQRIHKEIKEKTKIGGIIIGSLIAGFLISFLEFACTGQVYLPTISFVISRADFIIKPISALIVYNIMFITPLIIIAIFANIVSNESIANKMAKRIPLVKILTAILFFFLGTALLFHKG